MIIEFKKYKNFYDEFKNDIYKNTINDDVFVRYNFVPIEIYGEKYIITNTHNLEGYFYDYNNDIPVNIYIGGGGDDLECIKHIIKNLVIFDNNLNKIYDENKNQCQDNIFPDCYVDLIFNLVIIKFNSSKLNYIKISPDLDCEKDLRPKFENLRLKYIWVDGNMNQNQLIKSTRVINPWIDEYLNLPAVPKIIDLNHDINETNPVSGSPVYDDRDNLIGIVSYINEQEIIITPLICIKKIAEYLLSYNSYYLCLDVYPIKFDFKSYLNDINYTDGLLITNNYYDIMIDYKNKFEKKIKLLKKKNSYDFSSTNNETCNNTNNINHESINDDFKNMYLNEQLKLNVNNSTSTEQNNLMLRLFDKFDIKRMEKNYCYLRKGCIICSIDNYKIYSNGFINISSGERNKNPKLIPFKSYLWLFKNRTSCEINLNIISSNNYRGDLTKIVNCEETLSINDSQIKKHVNIINAKIVLKYDLRNSSSLEYSKFNNITYKYFKIVELNEKMLGIINEFLSSNKNIYKYLIDYIMKNKYTHENEKILLLFDFRKKELAIKIISKEIKNFNELINIYKTKNEQKKFILEISNKI